MSKTERGDVSARARRDALAAVLQLATDTAAVAGRPVPTADQYADAVIEAGWRPPPPMITDPAGLDVLPAEAVIRDALGVLRHRSDRRWSAPTGGSVPSEQVPLPATVLDPGL